MNSFLELVAKDLYQKCDGNFQNLTIIFPNKRASLFFNQHIFSIANAPLWAPTYLTISELFQTLSPLEVADTIELVCRLYQAYEKAYQQNGEAMDETLDKFYSWGELMLSDFQDIDNNHVDAQQLFRNISDLNDLTRFDYLTKEQVKALQEYFQDFDISTLLKENYMSLWKILPTIYTCFRKELRTAGLAYEGMLKRNVVSRLGGVLPDDERLSEGQEAIAQQKVADFKERIQQQKFAIVGFNVLNKTEQEMFKFLKENSQVYFYWDFDEAYQQQKADDHKVFEAGRFIYEDMQAFPNEFKPDTETYRLAYRNFASSKKHITYISSPTENAQTQYIGTWMQQCHLQAEGEPLNQSAIVLCNENLLQSVLHSIPVDEEFAKRFKLNVTMGYPLLQTPISSYLMAVLDLQLHGYHENRSGNSFWRYAQVAAVLKHPYTNRLGGDMSRQLLSAIKSHNILFPSVSLIENLPVEQNDEKKAKQEEQQKAFLLQLFTKQNSMRDLLNYLLQLIQSVGNSYRLVEKTFDYQLYVESVFNAFKIVNRLLKLEESGILRVEPFTLSRLLFQIINSHSLPFHGEPAVGIQLMGVLETRNLDFKNVLMLSVNEGNLPKSETCSSFIPYFLREEYHLTTRDKRNSLYAYYFYRLVQRAENVTLIYNNSTEGTSRGEMSRFMKQMLVEQEDLQLAHKIELKNLSATNVPYLPSSIVVPKSEEVMEQLRGHFVWGEDGSRPTALKPSSNGYLSPSAINTYIDCPLQFYFQKVAQLYPEEELTDDVEDNTFGSIFHFCMSEIYTRLGIGKTLIEEDINSILSEGTTIAYYVDRAFNHEFFHESDLNKTPTYNGNQLLIRSVIITYVKNQLEYDRQFCPLTIIEVEKEHSSFFKLSNGSTVKLGGIIDRIDLVHLPDDTDQQQSKGTDPQQPKGIDQLRILDYKTSAKVKTANSVEALFDSKNTNRSNHIMQAFYYADIYSREESVRQAVGVSLMYVKLAKEGGKEKKCNPLVMLDNTAVRDFAHQSDTTNPDVTLRDAYHSQLLAVIDSIFNPDVPFTQAPTNHPCKYCKFLAICGREKPSF
ncbi:MAG: PD-(D/E)XK nuclease family protein [Bacteroidaceae bacterium]|nr:PD-(D/E)XK nuclease family protein [Bacteroidaceae bacterium]